MFFTENSSTENATIQNFGAYDLCVKVGCHVTLSISIIRHIQLSFAIVKGKASTDEKFPDPRDCCCT